MEKIIPEKLKQLSEKLSAPLYIVGGFVRNYLLAGFVSEDCDIAGNIPVEELSAAAKDCGFTVVCEYKRTGTVVIKIQGRKYEYTRFRTDNYFKGEHTPYATEFTGDLEKDARRRDFKCNAVYYDVKNCKYVDPLGGIQDIKNRVLDTVTHPKEVFRADGLRLLRLARFTGELGFTPAQEVVSSAKCFADNIKDISVERIYAELKKILVSDAAYPFSGRDGHYNALRVLDETRVLDRIIPELAIGRGMAQRADYHNYDILEHTLRTVLYSDKEIRLSALLHDVGKPYCMINYGKYHGHEKEGAVIAGNILKRLKADVKTAKEVVFLTEFHMLDMKSDVRENKLKMFIVKNFPYIPKLLKLKQADFSAGKDDLSVAPTVIKWNNLIRKMQDEGVPFSLKELNISALDLQTLGYKDKEIGETLDFLWRETILNPRLNDREKLLTIAAKEKGNG